MPPAQNKKVVQQMLEVFNTGKVEVLDKVVSRDHIDESPFPGTKGDRDGLKKQIQTLRQAFPDAKFSIDRITAQGDTVAFRWTMVGTHRGNLLGRAATNKQVKQSGIDVVTLKDGMIVQHASGKNMGDLLATLGFPADEIAEAIK